MPPPTPLHIATQAVQRLLKEETYYKKELKQQEGRVEKLEDEIKAGGGNEDGNAEFVLKQEQKAIEETKGIFAPLRQRVEEAVAKLEEQIAVAESADVDGGEELAKAKEMLDKAKATTEVEA